MKIITVLPFKKGIWKENLTYFSSKDIQNGSIVGISLRNKKSLGLVISSEEVSSAKSAIKKMDFDLKKILEVKEYSLFKTEFIESVFLCSKYFIQNPAIGMASLIPSILREEYDQISEFFRNEVKALDSKENLKLSLKNNNIKNEKLLFQAKIEDRINYYKTYIRSSFAQKKSVFIVLPTKNDITQWEEYLEKGIEQFTISIHGGLNIKKQLAKIKEMMISKHPILILATAPYLAVAREDIGTIILENEYSNAYKMMFNPYFDLRVFVEILSSKINTKLILGDTLLRFETISRYKEENLGEVAPMSFRIPFKGKIEIKEKKKNLKFKILTEEINLEMQEFFKKKSLSEKEKKKIFVFSLRRGLATYTLCKNCGETINCDKCLIPMVLHISNKNAKERIFICNKCGSNKNTEITCSLCKSWNLMPLGIGIDTVYEEIKKDFNHLSVLKINKEIAKNSLYVDKIIKEFEKSDNAILVGTELALSYLKDKVDYSIIASFDSLWSISNFKISEKIIQLILSIASKTKEKIIIQTKNNSLPTLLAIKDINLSQFIKNELKDRQSLGYPPYKRFIKIIHFGEEKELTKITEYLKKEMGEYMPIFYDSLIQKTKDKKNTNILFKIDPKNWSPSIFPDSSIDENLYIKLYSLKKMMPNIILLVDPENLL